MKAKKFEQQFDDDVDLTASLDLSKAKRVLQEQKRVNVDFPTWMIDSLDREASKLGVTRQSVIKVWLAERLEATTSGCRSNACAQVPRTADSALKLQQVFRTIPATNSNGSQLAVSDLLGANAPGGVRCEA